MSWRFPGPACRPIVDPSAQTESEPASRTLLPLASSRPGPTAIGDLEDREPVPVRFAQSGVEAIWDPTKGTLLDLAESEGLEPIYSCRSGVCQTCAVSVLGGSVDYTDPPAAPPPDGMALICAA